MTVFKFTSSVFIAQLLLLSVLSGAPLWAQATASEAALRTPAQADNPVADAKSPDAIQALTPSIVTVTRIKPEDGDPTDKPVSHAGVVVDPRGYIVIPLLPSPSKPKLFTVRFADQKEVMGQLAAIDESLKFGVLKIERPQLVAAVSLGKSGAARVDDLVRLVPSPACKELRGGRVTSTSLTLGDEGSAKLIQTDVTFPLSEYGSLMVSESGEPLGIFMAARTTPKPESIVLPLNVVLPLITAAIDKPKDVPLVTVPASPPAVDLHKPVQISLEPATPLAKSLVERFGPRGAKVLDYEEGKRLKIEAPPLVLEEIGKAFKLAARENQKPEAKTDKPTDAPVESPKPTSAEPVADSKMPDITGTWSVKFVSPEIKAAPIPEMEIRRVQNGATDFLIDQPWVIEPTRFSVKWSSARQRFEGEFGEDEEDRHKISLQPLADLNSMRVIISEKWPSKKKVTKDGVTSEVQSDDSTQEWTRTSLTFSTTFPAKRYGMPETMGAQPNAIEKVHEPTERLEIAQGHVKALTTRDAITRISIAGTDIIDFKQVSEKELIVIGKGVGSTSLLLWFDQNREHRTILVTVTRATSTVVPDTPAAKQLVEQLAAQESAAASEAATIRQLQSNGQAARNKQLIAEHQRKLKNLLSTAFDLKLQWEELQVKELQSRLSRLERQIGQRKELREKIINRRAGELIEGDALRWDATAPASTKLPNSSVGNTKKAAKTATPAAVAILRERFGLLWDDLRTGKAKPDAVLRALNELAQAEPPEAHAQHVELLQGLLELVRRLQSTDSVSKAEVLEIEAAYEKARSLNDGASSKTSPLEPPEYVSVTPEADDIVVDLYGGSQVLPGLGKNPGYSKLIQSLNAMKGVTVNIREAGQGNVIVMAIVRDPSQRCQREARQTQKESELRIAINSALKAAGIEAARWDESAAAENAESKSADEVDTQTRSLKPDPLPSPAQLREQLEPFAKRVTAAEGRVHELEAVYFRDRSNAAELQRAFEEMTAARIDYRQRLNATKPGFKQIEEDYNAAGNLAIGLRTQYEAKLKLLAEGKATEAEIKAVADSWKRATVVNQSAFCECLLMLMRLMQAGLNDGLSQIGNHDAEFAIVVCAECVDGLSLFGGGSDVAGTTRLGRGGLVGEGRSDGGRSAARGDLVSSAILCVCEVSFRRADGDERAIAGAGFDEARQRGACGASH